jgi:hypothetical protein
MGAVFRNGLAGNRRFAVEHLDVDLISKSYNKAHKRKHSRALAKRKGSGLSVEMASFVLSILPQTTCNGSVCWGELKSRDWPHKLALPSKPTAHGEPLIRREYEGFCCQREDLPPLCKLISG